VGARKVIGAYHRGEREVSGGQLDAALGLAPRARPDEQQRAERAHRGQSTVDVPTPYAICRGLFQALALGEDDTFVDLGCGTGRVILYGALVTPARFEGVELVASRAAAARAAARRLDLDRVRAIAGDAQDADLSRGTVFYAFRPFSEAVQKRVLDRLHVVARGRPITVAAHRLRPASFDPDTFRCVSSGALLILRSHSSRARR
jgi:SAM-dependent methyltransferase